MDSEQQYVLQWVKYIAIAFISFAALLVGSCQMTNYRIAEGINAGKDPLAVRCAYEIDDNRNCVLKYAQGSTP